MEDLIKMYKAIIFCLQYSRTLTTSIDDIRIEELIKLMQANIDRLKTGRKWWDTPSK